MMVYSIEIIHFIRNVFFVRIVLNLCEMNVMLNMVNKRTVRNVQEDYSDERQKKRRNDGFLLFSSNRHKWISCYVLFRILPRRKYLQRTHHNEIHSTSNGSCVFKIEMMRVEKVLIDEDDDDFED